MCGISGIIRFNKPVERAEIEQMSSVIAHRGPDGEGIWLDGQVALGHRRLSIIDLETGRQPMCNEDQTVWISYNGEIYNFLELRDLLEKRGHKFRSHSDTEVIIHAYEEWGESCVEFFRGMFAFGIVDQNKRRIFLARDHLGIKPLVYYQSDNCFAFASEIQALRQIDGICLDLDVQALDQYLFLQYIPAPLSIFKQIRKLPPAHRMSVTFDGKISTPEEYWRLEFRPNYNKSESQWIEELEMVLRDSVKAHLVSDVPFGAFLSGGVDSSAVVAFMTQILNKPVKTFSIGFEEDEYSELSYAEIAAKRWGTEHHVEIVKPDALSILPDLVCHYGEPFGDSSAIPTYYVCKMARKHVPMVLSGDGGDEAFAGYNSYFAWLNSIEGKGSYNRSLVGKLLYPIERRLFPTRFSPPPKYGVSLDNWLSIINYMPKELRQRLWRPEYMDVTNCPLGPFEREYARTEGFSNVHKVQYMDLKTYLPFDIMTKVDIASMIHGLEVRTPIVDRKVMEFAATLPESFNVGKGANGEWQGKLLLKKLMGKYYPQNFPHRNKMGFAVPLRKWFAKNGALHDELNERLRGPNSVIREYFEPKIVQHLIKINSTGPLWLLLFLDEWLKQAGGKARFSR